MIKQFVQIFLIWVGCALIFLAVGAFALEAPKYYGLAGRALATKGIVVAKEPENHRFIRYSYQVNQQEYTGLDNAGGINPPFDDLNPGDTVNVYYDPKSPGSSLMRNPKGQYESIIRGVAFMTLVGPIFCLLGLFLKGWLPGFGKRK